MISRRNSFCKVHRALRSARETSASGKDDVGGRERNGMNERSNGSWGFAYGDNLFAVIRMAKETIWQPSAYPALSYIHAAETPKHISPSSVRFGTVGYVYESEYLLEKWSENFFTPVWRTSPFSRVVFASRMGPTRRKLFAEIGILFTTFVGYRWPPEMGSVSFDLYIFLRLRCANIF